MPENKVMRSRVTLLLSLGLNIALVFMLLHAAKLVDLTRPYAAVRAQGVALSTRVGKTNVVIRRLNFTWNDIESTDFPTYIANLRAIQCPETTIRDIIVAEVNQVYEQKRATEIVTTDQQWWRSEPDMDFLEASLNKQEALDQERKALLTQLLGPGWEVGPVLVKVEDGPRLDGPVLGNLSPETKASLRKIEAQSVERQKAYTDSLGPDKAANPAELARLRLETRAQLAAILTPEQLEEYLLRYSYNAVAMRSELNGFGATADEFRAIFRARDTLDQQIQGIAAGDPGAAKMKAELERAKEEAVRQALGPDRYPLYRMTQDPLFRQAQKDAEQGGAPPEKVLPIYAINRATQQEANRITIDPTLTPEQRAAALEAARAQQKAAIEKLLGPEEAQ